MNFDNITNATILYLKFIKSIFLTVDLDTTLELSEEWGIDYQSLELLKMLRDFVRPYTHTTSLPENVANNLYAFVSTVRFSYTEEDKKERFAVCNDIIGMLNSSQGKKEYPLYQSLIPSYFPSFKDSLIKSLAYYGDPEVVKTQLAAIVQIEYAVLYTHSEVVDFDTFMEDVCEDLLLSSVYLVAVEHLLREYPNMKYDEKFMARVRFVLRNNDLLLKQYNGSLDEDCIYELNEDDEAAIKDDKFWKLQQKVKIKVGIGKKDS